MREELKGEIARLVSGGLRDEDVGEVFYKYPRPISRVVIILARLELQIDKLELSKPRKGETWDSRLAELSKLKKERDYYEKVLESLSERRRRRK